ncbi:unnamed protein product [Soboliphyme baturini]|uniref:DUF608 domain-containing protein n=1 Tax=Soboliphyme baturini TaxID=241478 RepID=A0A183J4M9_9BILA|nr:unnamed protein product [Soboliphyme baturini]
MSDQLCGYGYLFCCCNGEEILPRDKVMKSLQKIFSLNVCSFKNGTMGAVNGMMPDGNVDLTSLQSQEMWIGVTYFLAALMIRQVLICFVLIFI